MGFWNSLASAAGEKTGKAIGNMVFGNKAADQTVNVNTNNASGGSGGNNGGLMGMMTTVLEGSKESDELKLRRYEDAETIKRELRDVEYDSVNIQNNYAVLLKLIPLIESEMRNCEMSDDGEIVDSEGFYKLAISKYNTWVTMLQIQDAANPNIVVLQNKQKEWEAYWQMQKNKAMKENAKEKRVFLYVFIFFLGLIGLLILFANEW